MTISKELLENRSWLSNSVMWNQQLPGSSDPGPGGPRNIPVGVEVKEDGSAVCRFYAPEATSVSVGFILGDQVPSVKDENGVWTSSLTFDFPGLKVIVWKVNGVEVLNPYAPIGYGYGRPMNYVDIPCEEQEYLAIKDVPHGNVVREWFKSETTGAWESCLVYLPPMYDEDPERRFPVLYLQHGGSQNENGWVYEAKTNFIMDNLLAEGKAEPCIIVMNNGMVQVQNGNGEWVVDSDKLKELLINDCIPFIDKKYRTLSDAWNRAYAGLSMGSLQGSVIFMDCHDTFASAGLFTGFLRPNFGGRPVPPQPHLKALEDVEKFNKLTRLFFISVGANEESIDKVKGEDELLTEKGIPHVFRAYPGGHEWHVWRASLYDYLQLLFR